MYSYATEYLELTTIKKAVKWFVDNEHLPVACRIFMKMAKPTESSTYCWTVEEATAIVEFCRKQNNLNWLGDVVTALACSGLRISELAGLRWSDVDFTKNVILLTDESTLAPRRRHRPVRTTKNRSSRTFPIQKDLRAVLESRSRGDGDLIFRGPRGGTLKPDTVRRFLTRDVLAKLASRFATPKGEVGFANGRLHSFRHYFCSRCANLNVPERVVKEWLGHKSSRMVRRYYHLHDDEAQRQMSKLSFVDSIETGVKRSAG